MGARMTEDELESDIARLQDLAKRHGLSYRRAGSTYRFDDRTGAEAFEDGCIYTVQGLKAALAFAEGFDRASEKTSGARA